MNLYRRIRILSSNIPGASAASAALRNSGVESPEGEEGDQGDGVNNELVLRYKSQRTDIVMNCRSLKSFSHQVQSSGTLVINLMALGYTSHQRARS
jgi:hypothetical protein